MNDKEYLKKSIQYQFRIIELEETASKAYKLIKVLHDSGCLDEERLRLINAFYDDATINAKEE